MARILVVDDEPDVRFLLRTLLERAGHEVVEAANGADAMDQAGLRPPELVVTDMMMPVMNGWEFIRRLRADPATADIPILVVSAHGDVQETPADVIVLPKPFRLAGVLDAVNHLLTRKANGT